MSEFPAVGAEEDFRTFREFLDASGYTDTRVAARTGVPDIIRFTSIRDGRTTATELADAMDLLIRLFMDAEMLPRTEVAVRMPAPVLAAAERLGILVPARSDQSKLHTAMLLYPTRGVYIASDLTSDPDAANPIPLTDDVVYPAITQNTGRFLDFVPTGPCDRFLELCAGTGVAALVAARTANHAWAADITGRSTRYARFNAALNGLTNVTAVEGDLYQPVAGLTFDRIAAHPPYVPAEEQKLIYRDGGPDGEQVLRGVLAGLADHLAPGGRCYITCVASDRKDGRLEERLRRMLGPKEGEFDVLVVVRFDYDPVDYYARVALLGRGEFATLESKLKAQQALGIEALAYSAIVIQRRDRVRPVVTRRRQMGPATTLREVDWLLDWEAAATEPAMRSRLLEARPRVSPATSVQVLMRQADPEGWVPTECTALAEWPFVVQVKCPAWVTDLLAQCDGSMRGGDLMARFKAAGFLPAADPEAVFVDILRLLVGAGVLTVPDFALPPLPEAPPPRVS